MVLEAKAKTCTTPQFAAELVALSVLRARSYTNGDPGLVTMIPEAALVAHGIFLAGTLVSFGVLCMTRNYVTCTHLGATLPPLSIGIIKSYNLLVEEERVVAALHIARLLVGLSETWKDLIIENRRGAVDIKQGKRGRRQGR